MPWWTYYQSRKKGESKAVEPTYASPFVTWINLPAHAFGQLPRRGSEKKVNYGEDICGDLPLVSIRELPVVYPFDLQLILPTFNFIQSEYRMKRRPMINDGLIALSLAIPRTVKRSWGTAQFDVTNRFVYDASH